MATIANALAAQLADQIENSIAQAAQDPDASKEARKAANKLAWANRGNREGAPSPVDDGGVVPPGPDEHLLTGAPAPGEVAAPPPAMPNVVAFDAQRKAQGKPAPTRASQVGTPTEMLRIFKVDARGKQAYIQDYTIAEISAGGPDLEGFVARTLAPTYKAGDYAIYKHGNSGLVFYQNVTIAAEAGAPVAQAPQAYAPPQPAQTPAMSMREMDELAERRRAAERAAAAEAEAKVRAEEERRKKDREDSEARTAALMAKLEERKRAGESGPLDTLMTMKLMESMNGPKDDPRIGQLFDGMNQLAQQIQMLPSMMPQPAPLPPPPPPGPSVVEITTGVATALAGLVTPLIGIWQNAKAAETAAMREAAAAAKASEMTAEKAMALATGAVTLATSMGLIGKKEASPLENALAERIKAEINAEPADPFEQMGRMLQMIEQLKPKEGINAKSVLEVVDHAIDRMPDVFDAFGRLADKRMGNLGNIKMLTDSKGKATIPAPFAQLRADVLKLMRTTPEGRERDIALLRLTIPLLAKVYQAGGAWTKDTEALLEAAKLEDVGAVKQTFAQMVRLAWAKDDADATKFFREVAAVWSRYPREIGVLLRGEKPPEAETAAGAEEDSADDLLAEEESVGGETAVADAAAETALA